MIVEDIVSDGVAERLDTIEEDIIEDSITDEDRVSDRTAVDDTKEEMLLLATTLVAETDSD
jgi:hypothetical protein